MTHKYIEVKDGNHIRAAITQLPAILELFATHARKIASKKKAADSDD